MDNKNGFCYERRSRLDVKSLICCAAADWLLVQRCKVPFVSAFCYILLSCMDDQICKQDVPIRQNEPEKEGKVIMPNTHEDNDNEKNFQYGKTYYFDKSGLPIDECEILKPHPKCKNIVETCCLIEIPRGFRITDSLPSMCFNLSELSCVKNPIMQEATLPACECEQPKHCEIVAGYEIRAVGEVNFSLSVPINPISGFCYPKHSYACRSSTVPVNKIISHTCCPKPCSCIEPCVDWNYAYFCATIIKDDCVSYIKARMGIVLEYTGECECDEE